MLADKRSFFVGLVFLSIAAGFTLLSEGFDSDVFPPLGWSIHRGSNDAGQTYDWEYTNLISYSGSGAARVRYENSSLWNEDWMLTPPLMPTAAECTLSWFQQQTYRDDYNSTYKIGVSLLPNFEEDAWVFPLSWHESESDVIPHDYFQYMELDLSSWIGTPIRVAFLLINDNGDDFIVDEVGGVPLLEIPSVLVVSAPLTASLWASRLEHFFVNVIQAPSTTSTIKCGPPREVVTAITGGRFASAATINVTYEFSAVFVDPAVPSASSVGTALRLCACPVVVADPDVYVDIGLAIDAASTGRLAAGTSTLVMDEVHPLAAGFSGALSLPSTSLGYAAGSSGLVVAYLSADSDKGGIVLYDAGDIMPPGFLASNMRIAFPLDIEEDETAKFLLNATIDYALNGVTCPEGCSGGSEVCEGGACRCTQGLDSRPFDGDCEDFMCPSEPVVTASGYQFGSFWPPTLPHLTATVACPEGLSGNISRRCAFDASWDDAVGSCIGCRETPAVDEDGLHLLVSWPNSPVNSTQELPCPQGFIGNVTLQCGPNSEWNLPEGVCNRSVPCGPSVSSCGTASGCAWCDKPALCQNVSDPCANCSVLSADECLLEAGCSFCSSTQVCGSALLPWIPTPYCPPCNTLSNATMCEHLPGCRWCEDSHCIGIEETCEPYCPPITVDGGLLAIGTFDDGFSPPGQAYGGRSLERWTVSVPAGAGTRVLLSLSKFVVDKGDVITIFDGDYRDSPKLIELVDGFDPDSLEILSSSRLVTIEAAIHQAPTSSALGFSFAYEATDSSPTYCSGHVDILLTENAPSFTFASHVGRGLYAPDSACSWSFNASEGNVVVEISSFALSSDLIDSLLFSSVEYDGNLIADCRGSYAPKITGGFPVVDVTFSSDGELHDAGFIARAYRSLACPNGCSGNGECVTSVGQCVCDPGWSGADCSETVCFGARVLSETKGSISPTLNDGEMIGAGLQCEWQLSRPVEFSKLIVRVRSSSLSANEDRIVITLGMDGLGTKMTEISGSGYEEPKVINVGALDGVNIHFESRRTGHGFVLDYEWRDERSCPGCGYGLCSTDGECSCPPLYEGTACADGKENHDWSPLRPTAIVGRRRSADDTIEARTAGCMVRESSTTALLFGGITGGPPVSMPSNVFRYNLTDNTWSLLSDGSGSTPSGRSHFACSMLSSGHLFVHGGYADVSANILLDDAWLFNTTDNDWTEASGEYGSVLSARARHTSCEMAPGVLLLFHGEVMMDGTGTSTAEVFEVMISDTAVVASQITVGEVAPRTGHSIVCLEDRAIVHGGRSFGGEVVSTFEIFSYESREWTSVAPELTYATPRANFQAVLQFGGQMLLFGGLLSEGVLHSSSITIYDTKTNTLFPPTAESTAIEPREHATTCIVGGALIIQGGLGYSGTYLHDFWVWTNRPSSATTTVAINVPGNATAGIPFTFSVEARDEVGGRVPFGGDIFDVRAVPVSFDSTGSFVGTLTTGAVRDRQNGIYDISLQGSSAVEMDVFVSLEEVQSGAIQEIVGSPYRVEVLPASTSVSACVAESLEANLVMDVATELQVQARDKFGNNRRSGGDVFIVSLLEPEFRRSIPNFSPDITDFGNGKYGISYSVDRPGQFLLAITGEDEKHIFQSPFSLEVGRPPPEEVDLTSLIGSILGTAAGLLVCACFVAAIVYAKWRRDHPPWRINPNELLIDRSKIIGRGASAEVYLATYRGMKVAVKELHTSKEPRAIVEGEEGKLIGSNSTQRFSTGLAMEFTTGNFSTNLTTNNLRTMQGAGPTKVSKSSFMEEVSMLCSLRHPDVVLVIGACLEKRQRCIVLQYMSQGSLFDVLHNPSLELGWKRKLDMAKHAAQGIDFLHKRSPPLIHKDIKSLNFLVDETFSVKVTDFGLDGKKKNRVLGTTQWAAPEVLPPSSQPPTLPSDVYSFGVVLWEIASREEPYHGQDRLELPQRVVDGYRPRISKEWPADFSALMSECMVHDPVLRPKFPEIVSRIKRLEEETPEDSESGTNSALLRKVYTQEEIDDAKGGMFVAPKEFASVAFLFCHVVDFHEIEEELTPAENSNLLRRLNELYDSLCLKWNIDKVETIGDMLLAVGGLDDSEDEKEIAVRVANTALELLNAEVHLRETGGDSDTRSKVTMRVGLHAGPVVASVSGTTNRKLTFVGDTVNTTSRMESHGEPGKAQLSPRFNDLLAGTSVPTVSRGYREIKGKGKMETFFLRNPLKEGLDVGSFGLPHIFANITSESQCDFCKCSIGHFKRGMRCTECFATAHFRCRLRLPYSCPGRHIA